MEPVIKLTRINGADILVNPDLIQTIERHADTVIALTNGDKILVKNGLEDITEKIITYRAEIRARSRTAGR